MTRPREHGGERPPLGRALLLAAAIATAAALVGLPGHATKNARTTADEPQYLLTARSIVDDGDLDISDERAAGVWRAYHAAPLPVQTRPLADGARISPHDPLLAVLLAPGVAVGGWMGAKVTLAVLAGVLAAVLVWTAVARLGVRQWVAVVVTGLCTASVPLAPYGTQIYPEIPAALAVAVAVAALLGPPRASTAVAVGAVCCALPWLGVKYVPVGALLAAWAAVALWRAGHHRAVAALAVGLLVAGAGYLLVHRWVWTGWTVYASADHFVGTGELSVVGVAPDHWARTTRLVGLLVERSFGIAAWQPAWLLLVAAVAAAVRARPPGWALLVAVVVVGWLNASYVALTMAGWWMPGRQVVVVLPAAVLLCAWWADQRTWATVVAVVLGVVGVVAWLVLSMEAALGHVTLVVDFFDTANPVYRMWRWLLPDYLAPSAATWWRHAGWLVALTAVAAAGWRSSTPPGPQRRGSEPAAPVTAST